MILYSVSWKIVAAWPYGLKQRAAEMDLEVWSDPDLASRSKILKRSTMSFIFIDKSYIQKEWYLKYFDSSKIFNDYKKKEI